MSAAVDKLGGPEVGIAIPISILHEMQKLNRQSDRPLNLESLTPICLKSHYFPGIFTLSSLSLSGPMRFSHPLDTADKRNTEVHLGE